MLKMSFSLATTDFSEKTIFVLYSFSQSEKCEIKGCFESWDLAVKTCCEFLEDKEFASFMEKVMNMGSSELKYEIMPKLIKSDTKPNLEECEIWYSLRVYEPKSSTYWFIKQSGLYF